MPEWSPVPTSVQGSYVTPHPPPPQPTVCPASEVALDLGKCYILTWGIPPLWAELRTGSTTVRKCANTSVRTLNNWLAGEDGTLHCLLLTLICLKLLLLIEPPGIKQPAYKKHPGECGSTCTVSKRECLHLIGSAEQRTDSHLFFFFY